MQSQLIAGDSLNMLDAYPDFPATDGWTLKTVFTPLNATGTKISMTATAEGSDYRTQVAPATTTAWLPGKYAVHQTVEKDSQRVTVATGELTLLPDPATMIAGTDTRSHVQRTLDNLEAMIEGRATKDVQEYTIGDRQLKHMEVSELIKWRNKYSAYLANEKAINSGKKPNRGRIIYARFK